MEKLVKRIEELRNYNFNLAIIKTQDEYIAEEARRLAVEFSKYLRVNDYLPQLVENGDIGYVKSTACWREGHAAEVYSKDDIFNKFIDEYYK